MQQEAPFKQQESQSQNQSLPTQKQLKSDSQVQEQPDQDNNACLSFKVKIIIAVTILLIALGVGLGVGLYFRLRTTIEPVGPSRMVRVGNNEYIKIQSIQIKEKSFMSQDVATKVMVTQALKQTSQTSQRLLQSEPSKTLKVSYYNIHAILEEIGCQVTFTSDNKLIARVDPQILVNYLMKNEPSELNSTDNETTGEPVDNFTQELNYAFRQAFDYQHQFNFSFVESIDLVFNDSTSKFEFITNNQTGRRMLTVRNLGWLKKLGKRIMKTVKKIVKPVVNIVRNFGPQIGCLVGSVVAGPAGCKLGSSIGQGVKGFINSCIPQYSLKIKCTAEGVLQTIYDSAVENIIGDSYGIFGHLKNQVQTQKYSSNERTNNQYGKLINQIGGTIGQLKNQTQNQSSYGPNGGGIGNMTNKTQNQEKYGQNGGEIWYFPPIWRWLQNSGAIAGIKPPIQKNDANSGTIAQVKSQLDSSIVSVASSVPQVSSSYSMVSNELSLQNNNVTSQTNAKTSGTWVLMFIKQKWILLLGIWLLLSS